MLDEIGLDFELGRVQVLTNLRNFGYVFNPVSLYFCFDNRGVFRALLSEVNCLDVVIGKKTVEHDFKSTFAGEGNNRPSFQCSVGSVIPKTMENFNDTDFSVHFGVIASGDEDINVQHMLFGLVVAAAVHFFNLIFDLMK